MSSNMVFEMVQEIAPEAVIKVIGVGGVAAMPSIT